MSGEGRRFPETSPVPRREKSVARSLRTRGSAPHPPAGARWPSRFASPLGAHAIHTRGRWPRCVQISEKCAPHTLFAHLKKPPFSLHLDPRIGHAAIRSSSNSVSPAQEKGIARYIRARRGERARRKGRNEARDVVTEELSPSLDGRGMWKRSATRGVTFRVKSARLLERRRYATRDGVGGARIQRSTRANYPSSHSGTSLPKILKRCIKRTYWHANSRQMAPLAPSGIPYTI